LNLINIRYPNSQQSRPIRILVAVEAEDGQIFIDQADVLFQGLNFQANVGFNLTDNIPALSYLLFLISVLIIGPYFLTNKGKDKNKKIKI
jgi:hypothetical protein